MYQVVNKCSGWVLGPEKRYIRNNYSIMGLILKKINGQESKFLKFHYLHFDLLN